MSTLALFDFDKTLYSKDSLIEFTKFCKGRKCFYLGMIHLLPGLLAMKARLISNEKMKEKFIKYFFQNLKYTDFEKNGREFASEIDKHLDKKFSRLFQSHLASEHTVTIVTASCSGWIKPWADQYNILVLATEIKVVENKIAGFSTPNCNGKEKVARIKSAFNLDDFDRILVYGNGRGDKEMLKLRK